jgi:hypothetical protein
VSYPYREGTDLLTGASARTGQKIAVKPWDLAIVAEK